MGNGLLTLLKLLFVVGKTHTVAGQSRQLFQLRRTLPQTLTIGIKLSQVSRAIILHFLANCKHDIKTKP